MHSAHCAAVSVVPYTLQAKMSISGRRGQGKSEAGGSVTHCALKRFITPSVLKFKKRLLVFSCFNKSKTDGHITSKDKQKGYILIEKELKPSIKDVDFFSNFLIPTSPYFVSSIHWWKGCPKNMRIYCFLLYVSVSLVVLLKSYYFISSLSMHLL